MSSNQYSRRSALINTPLQRGVEAPHEGDNRFSGLPLPVACTWHEQETAEAVAIRHILRPTPLKWGADEKHRIRTIPSAPISPPSRPLALFDL